MADERCCFLGRGNILLGKYDKSCGFGPYPPSTTPLTVKNHDAFPLLQVGNVSDFSLVETISKIEGAKNYRDANPISECPPYESVESIAMSATLHCMSVANLKLALSGIAETKAAETGATQVMSFVKYGQFIPYRADDGTVITGVRTTPVDVTGFGVGKEVGKDYVLTPNGVMLPEGSTIALNTDLTITYDAPAYDVIQYLTSLSDEYRLFFDGINVLDGGRPFSAELFRFKISPGGIGSWISDNVLEWKMSASVLPDNCRRGIAGKSLYGTFPFAR
jgi:hypothetical protein